MVPSITIHGRDDIRCIRANKKLKKIPQKIPIKIVYMLLIIQMCDYFAARIATKITIKIISVTKIAANTVLIHDVKFDCYIKMLSTSCNNCVIDVCAFIRQACAPRALA